jgi:TolB-like protein/DNA-binding winged helix-turn-helix (wHTH) protein
MAAIPSQPRVVKFGVFEVDLQAGEVRKAGMRQKLAGQPFQVLQALLEHPQEIVTREELRERIWPGNAFIDYELALKKAVNRLRELLGDSAESPHFIETVPRRGYRFIGTITSPPPFPSDPREPPALGAAAVAERPVATPPAKAGTLWKLISVLALGGVAALLFWSGSGKLRGRIFAKSRTVEIRSIAVLPLVNLSSDPEQEYFSDGMTDELITDLARFGELKVISHTSVERYKDTKRPLSEIARELGVDAVVEGRVMRAGERVRITVQLIDARTDRHLWAESYERDLRDVLALQDEVARDIATEIQIQVNTPETRRPVYARTVNPEAHEAYLKGLYFWNKRSAEGVRKSIEYFEQATRLDPNYAVAYAGLAESYVVLNGYRFLPPDQAFPRVRAAALRALELDEKLAEAHTSLGSLKWEYEWDASGAKKEYKRAIELTPSYATGHQWYAEYLAAVGREDEALAEIKRAQELDPLSLPISAVTGWILYLGGHYDQAIDQYRSTLELDSNFAIAHSYLGRAYVQKGNFEQAIIECKTATRLSEGHPFYMAWLAYAYAMAGNRREALRILNDLELISRRRYVAAHDIAAIYAGLGEKSKALEWLKKAYNERSYTVLQLPVEPEFDSLRPDPRFQDLLHRVGLPQQSQ